MTKFWITGRRTGKTFEIVEWMSDDEELMCIVFSLEEGYRIADTYELNRNRFITPQQILNGRLRGMSRVDLVVDNLELVLDGFTYPNGTVKFATATGELFVPGKLKG